jgi:hypothetical protein
MKKNALYSLIGIAVLALGIGAAMYWMQGETKDHGNSPKIDAADFVSAVDNTYFTLKPGTTFTYENQTDEGLEKIVVIVTDESKQVLGIPMTVVWDRVWLSDVLIEDTKDWYAQDKSGNVWYFGEDVDNYENGELVDHDGSWEAGVDGSEAGIMMKAEPKVGDSYRQEYDKGHAEDMGDVFALNKTVTVPYGTFDGCLQTRDWSTLETDLNEYKYYCPEVGVVTVEESVSGGDEKVELVSVVKE